MYTVSKNNLLNPRGLKEGTQYKFFNKKEDLLEGNIVYASKFAGKEIGFLSNIDEKNDLCKINNVLTFISDIKYLIIK